MSIKWFKLTSTQIKRSKVGRIGGFSKYEGVWDEYGQGSNDSAKNMGSDLNIYQARAEHGLLTN